MTGSIFWKYATTIIRYDSLKDEMKTNIQHIYAYLVCFVSIACGVIYTGVILYDIVEVAAAEFTLHELDKNIYLSNRNFIENNHIYSEPTYTNKYKDYSEDEITNIKNKEYQFSIEHERNNALKSIIQSLIIVFVDIILFYGHWRIANRAQMA